MKICIGNKYGTWDSAKTGKGFFAQRLISELKALKVEVTTDPKEDVDADLQFGKHAYKPKGKSIIRMGPVHIGPGHEKSNKVKREAIQKADDVIYQSAFGKKMCDAFIGEASGKTTVLFNGADPDYYNAVAGSISKGPRDFVASTREWTGQKRLPEIVEAFRAAKIKGSKLYILGHSSKKFKGDGVHYMGNVAGSQIGAVLAAVNTLVSIVWLDCMPNSVCEALCANCNVITTSTSGTAEIAPDLLLKEKPWDFKPCDQNKPPAVDIHELSELMKKSLEMPKPRCEHVKIDRIAWQYYQFIKEVVDA